jgi:hypothetical protein
MVLKLRYENISIFGMFVILLKKIGSVIKSNQAVWS